MRSLPPDCFGEKRAIDRIDQRVIETSG